MLSDGRAARRSSEKQLKLTKTAKTSEDPELLMTEVPLILG